MDDNVIKQFDEILQVCRIKGLVHTKSFENVDSIRTALLKSIFWDNLQKDLAAEKMFLLTPEQLKEVLLAMLKKVDVNSMK